MAGRLLALLLMHHMAVETRVSTEEQRRIPWYVVSLVIPLCCVRRLGLGLRPRRRTTVLAFNAHSGRGW